MKRLTIVLATVALAAGVLVALSGVASARETEPYAAEQAKLPPLPADIKERKRLNIAVKCDSPPFGYIGARSQQAGFDVEIAQVVLALRVRQGEPRHVHVRHDACPRAGDLTPGAVDMVIATFTYTTDRDTRIDFSRAYYKATGRLLVPNNSSTTLGESRRKDRRDDERLRLRPLDEELLQGHEGPRHGQLHERTDRVPGRPRGRAHVGRHGAARHRRDRSQLQADERPRSSRCPTASASSRATPHCKAWVNSRLNLMKKRDLFFPILRNTVPPAQVVAVLEEHPAAQAGVRLQPGRSSRRCARSGTSLRHPTERPRLARPLLLPLA